MERETILAKLRERILAFAASRYSRDYAEDLAQEVLLLLHQKYAMVEAMEELVPLSLRILRYKIADHRRKRARRGENTAPDIADIPLADAAPSPEAALARNQLRRRLLDSLGKLGGRCRELFLLKLKGMGFEEIRQRLGVESLNTVYTWDHRCRKQLRELMGDKEKEP